MNDNFPLESAKFEENTKFKLLYRKGRTENEFQNLIIAFGVIVAVTKYPNVMLYLSSF